jgi:hypothetical protein
MGPESKVTGVGEMARTGTPWAVVTATVLSALVAAGALVAAVVLRESTSATEAVTTPPSTPAVGIDGCLHEPCTVLATMPVGGTIVDLVADSGATSGRLRIGGDGSSEVIEATITDMGATLTKDSLQCVASTLSACLVRGPFPQGIVGQVVVGRSAKWSQIAQPFQSDAGYLALADVTSDAGAEVLVAQHRCEPGTADCSATPVYMRVFNLRNQEMGCTRNYARLDQLPEWPVVTLTSADLKPCA